MMPATKGKWLKHREGIEYPRFDERLFQSIGWNSYDHGATLEISLYQDTYTDELRKLAQVLTEMADDLDLLREDDDATEEG